MFNRADRTLKQYHAQRVVLTLDNASGVRGFVHAVHRDHIALTESQGIASINGEAVMEPVQPGISAIPLSRIVRLLTVPE